MDVRTIRKSVRFSSAFLLYGFDLPQPAGEYVIEYDEQQIEERPAGYQRVASFLHLPAVAAASSSTQLVPIDPDELEMALSKDRGEG
ncbi:hypothetical protein [Mesorhizobium sp. 1M-11]|uniref:hypothetical protein n=1 Tax=Mesorhizobium sp. 1M-11 TaxID=1529006 RepID=UPI0006C7594B|nr:hypothetical protein [Mesorhizobium sp. 1M-11]